jgi:hypothetical protein
VPDVATSHWRPLSPQPSPRPAMSVTFSPVSEQASTYWTPVEFHKVGPISDVLRVIKANDLFKVEASFTIAGLRDACLNKRAEKFSSPKFDSGRWYINVSSTSEVATRSAIYQVKVKYSFQVKLSSPKDGDPNIGVYLWAVDSNLWPPDYGSYIHDYTVTVSHPRQPRRCILAIDYLVIV